MNPLPPRKHRLALGLAVLAVVVVAAKLVPEWPVKQHVVLQLESPGSIRAITATWTREDEEVPRGGTRSAFSGGAPPQLERRMSVPNGDYVFRVNVERQVGTRLVETSRDHRVRLDGREVTVFVAVPSSP